MTKHEWIVVLLLEVIIIMIITGFYTLGGIDKITENQEQLELKLDSILTMQKDIYELDSMYLQTTRMHMGQCAFVLKEGIKADINN